MEYRFPFGQRVKESQPKAAGKKKLFVLGAYPSALHVAWQPPAPYRRISALAVDNEPEVFWDGSDEEKIIAHWRDTVGFEPTWGSIEAAGKLNGSSGRWVNENILIPLQVSRQDAFLTDCLNTYRISLAGAERVSDTYARLAVQYNLPAANLQPHPNENDIVKEALAVHQARLIEEVQAAQPDKIVTLGNAALKVIRQISTLLSNIAPQQLSPDRELYGKHYPIDIGGLSNIEWWPLAHPAAPNTYQETHRYWKSKMNDNTLDAR
jgi:uracil-DNA glycosylase